MTAFEMQNDGKPWLKRPPKDVTLVYFATSGGIFRFDILQGF